MKEKPIIFKTEMVRAILGDRKTVTRRIIKPQPINDWDCVEPIYSSGVVISWNFYNSKDIDFHGYIKCPYQVGTRLWVREKFAYHLNNPNFKQYVFYKERDTILPNNKWQPSIFMPRWASRIDLEVAGVRAERLQDITPEDAVFEGAEYMPAADVRKERLTVAQIVFAGYWDSINAKRGYSWEFNPWVYRIEFKRS